MTDLYQTNGQTHDEFDFDSQGLEPIFIPVTYREKHYILFEANADVAVKFRNMNLKAAKFTAGADGRPRSAIMDGMADSEPWLLSRCIVYAKKEIEEQTGETKWVPHFLPNGDIDRKHLVPETIIRTWHPKVMRDLFNKCMKISRLTEDEQKKQAPETVESLEKQIAELQLKLEKMRAAEQGEENPDPNPIEATVSTSP